MPATRAAPAPAEAEAVDLLRVAGGTRAARRVALGALGLVALVAVGWLVVRWITRSW